MEIAEHKLKEILNEQREEFQRYLGVVVEGLTGQIKLIAESLSDLQRQLAIVREMVAKNTEDIEIMKEDIGIMKMDINTIKNDLKQKVDREEFAALERRVANLEARRK